MNSTNDLGIWATDPNGLLQLIARTGDEMEVAPSDFRTITSFSFRGGSGTEDGRASSFNDRGQLAFLAAFADGSAGVFVSNLVAHLPGDFNNDGTVDAADYVVWRKNDGTQAGYDAWRANFGASLGPGSGSTLPSAEPLSTAVPEPPAVLFASIGLGVLLLPHRRSTHTYFISH